MNSRTGNGMSRGVALGSTIDARGYERRRLNGWKAVGECLPVGSAGRRGSEGEEWDYGGRRAGLPSGSHSLGLIRCLTTMQMARVDREWRLTAIADVVFVVGWFVSSR